MNIGNFDEQILREIERSGYFIPILSPHSLDRCAEPDDWVLKELSRALTLNKPIVPVLTKGFKFTDEGIPTLPEIEELKRKQAVEHHYNDFPGFLRRLLRLLKVRA